MTKIGSSKEKLSARLMVVWIFGLLISGLSPAQEEDITDPVVGYNKATAAVQAQRWDEGLAAANAIIKEHGSYGLKDYGPVFGHFYFLKNVNCFKVCEL